MSHRGLLRFVLLASLVVTSCAAWGPGIGRSTTPNSPAVLPGATGQVGTLPTAPTPTTVPSQTQTPTLTPTAPTPTPVPRDPQPFGFAQKGMTREVMAFVTGSQLQYGLQRLDLDVVSTIALFSLEAGGNGQLVNRGSRWRAWTSPEADALIARAHAAGTRVVLSLSRFAWTGAEIALSRQLLASAAHRARLAREVAAEVARRGIDGVNVDFEPIPVGQARAFNAFVRALRAELDRLGPGYQLTFDITGHFESYDVAGAMAPGGADAVYLMGYHYAGPWSTIAASNAPLGGPRYDVTDTIDRLLRLVRPDQLIVGVPYYGHLWPTTSGAIHAPTTGPGSDILYPQAAALAAKVGARYDPIERVSWSAWQERDCATCPAHWVQLYYDDARAVAAKWATVNRRELLGTGVWTIAFEGTPGALDRAMRAAFLAASEP